MWWTNVHERIMICNTLSVYLIVGFHKKNMTKTLFVCYFSYFYIRAINQYKHRHSWTVLETVIYTQHIIYLSSHEHIALLWRRNGRGSVSNHQPHECLNNRLFRRRSKKASKLRVTGLCAGNSPGIGEFPAQMTSNAENVSIWWRHYGGK